jgi:1-acyl-sn-glycerol-3-phosphate acyltransferase
VKGKEMTVHETPGIRTLMRWMALALFKFSGWHTEGKKPDLPKYVVIAAPHTSNWDFLFTVCLAFIYRINPSIMMKNAWFFWPLGIFFRWMGAFPIDRSKKNNVVDQSIRAFGQRDKMVLIVPPSGTRQKVIAWKTGFYHIANGADVPIALGFIDYRRKIGGFGPVFRPTGNIACDIKEIENFYQDVTGKNPGMGSRAPVVSSADRSC